MLSHKHIAFLAGAAIAYWYLASKTSAQAQTVPLISSVYNIGYNFASSGSFSPSSPVATA